ncbi:hypothetical protein H3U62_19780, partial [Clostridioides difficile]|nr:hypothetical protein [Clostridioides difficile]
MGREAWHAANMGSQRVRHDWATELNQCEPMYLTKISIVPPIKSSNRKG